MTTEELADNCTKLRCAKFQIDILFCYQDIEIRIFSGFLTVHLYLWMNIFQNWTDYSLYPSWWTRICWNFWNISNGSLFIIERRFIIFNSVLTVHRHFSTFLDKKCCRKCSIKDRTIQFFPEQLKHMFWLLWRFWVFLMKANSTPSLQSWT